MGNRIHDGLRPPVITALSLSSLAYALFPQIRAGLLELCDEVDTLLRVQIDDVNTLLLKARTAGAPRWLWKVEHSGPVGKNPQLSFLTVDGGSPPTHHLPLFIFTGAARVATSALRGRHVELFLVGPLLFCVPWRGPCSR